jgi:hypothetical protein
MLKCLLAAGAVVVVLAVAGQSSPASATEYKWCAQYGGSGQGGRNCGFNSFSQCMATVSGIGGFCERNQFYGRRGRR